MRTTLNIADDVLQAVRERARHENKTTGEVISELARIGLGVAAGTLNTRDEKAVHGLRPFGKRGTVVTNERIENLREDDAY